MNWAYIAGFFDGEGSVFPLMHNRRSPVVEISQSQTRGFLLLTEIQQFLGIHNILSTVKPLRARRSSLGKRPMYKLRIGHSNDALQFLQTAMPYLRVKRAEAQDVIRFHRMYPPKSTSRIYK